MSDKTIITVNEKIVSLQDRIATLTRQLAERDAEVEAAKRGVFHEDGTWWCRVSERDAALAEVERLRGQTCAMCQPLHAQLTAANATLAEVRCLTRYELEGEPSSETFEEHPEGSWISAEDLDRILAKHTRSQ